MFPFLPHIEALTSTTPGDAEAAQELQIASRENPEQVIPILDGWLASKLALVGRDVTELPWFEQLVGRWRGNDRHAFEGRGATLSYDELHRATARRASAWRAQGVKQGSTVCICRPFGARYVVDLLAGFRLGACVCWAPSLGEPYERRAVEAFGAEFVSAEPAAVRRLGPELAAALLVDEVPAELVPEAEGAARYSRQDSCLGVLSPKAAENDSAGRERLAWEPAWLDCESLQRAVARDAASLWRLRPGDAVAAPGFDDARHQPGLLLACLLAGATYHHVAPEEVARRTPRLQRSWRTFGVRRATLEALVERGSIDARGVDARGVDASANRAHGVVVERWFRDLEEEWDAELWTHFGRSFEQAPLLRAVLTDPALGGVVAATECSRDVYDNVVRIALGVGFAVAPLEGAPPDAGSGLLQLAGSSASPSVLLSELRGERYRYLGTARPRRAGAVYPRELVTEAVSTLPGVIGAAVVDVPRGGERAGVSFGLVVFVRASADWCQERQRRTQQELEGFLREVLAPELRPDFIECRPSLPRLDDAGAVDAGWVALQRWRGRLRQKSELRVFRELSSLSGGAV